MLVNFLVNIYINKNIKKAEKLPLRMSFDRTYC